VSAPALPAALAARPVVLFDAGGTLITLDYDRVRAAIPAGAGAPPNVAFDAAEARARRWADAALRKELGARGLWNGYFARVLGDAGVAAEAIPAALEALWRANRERGLWRRPVYGARGTLRVLHEAGRRLAVVSNAEGQVEADLVEAGFGEFLETVVDSALVGVAKPDPRIFAVCLERLGARPEECLYVGDVPAFDVVGARAAGIEPLLLDPHGVHADVDAPRLASLADLPAALGLEGACAHPRR